MKGLIWQLPIGNGVIDCALSRRNRMVIAGDVNGEVVLLDYAGNEQSRFSYPMPVWGIDISETADTFAVGLADKSNSKGGFIVVRNGASIFEQYTEAPVWDVKILTGPTDKILASTWGEGLYEYEERKVPLKQLLLGKSIFGISSHDGQTYLTVSPEGLYSSDAQGAYHLKSRSRFASYNNVAADGKVFYGSSSNILSVITVGNNDEKHYRTALSSPCALEIFGDHLLIGDLDGNFVVSKVDTPNIPIFHERFDGSIWNISADVSNSLIFVACGDGSLHSYDFNVKNLSAQPSAITENLEWIKSVLAGTKVFISYAHEDEGVVRSLCDSLSAIGCEPWVDFHSLLPGQKWKREISNAIKHCEFFVLCLSKHSTTKTGFVQKEIREALEMLELVPDGKIFLIPMRLDDCDIPESLSDQHCVSLFAEDGMAKLLRAMCHQKART
jgi:TIR domain